jgi:hypothetical protein
MLLTGQRTSWSWAQSTFSQIMESTETFESNLILVIGQRKFGKMENRESLRMSETSLLIEI